MYHKIEVVASQHIVDNNDEIFKNGDFWILVFFLFISVNLIHLGTYHKNILVIVYKVCLHYGAAVIVLFVFASFEKPLCMFLFRLL